MNKRNHFTALGVMTLVVLYYVIGIATNDFLWLTKTMGF